MDRVAWEGGYRRLLKAYSKPFSADQAGAYFDGLSDLGDAAVDAGVTACIREVRYFPSVADLRERAVAALRGDTDGPRGPYCPVCDGSGLIVVADDCSEEKHLADAVQLAWFGSQRHSRRFPRPLTRAEALDWVKSNVTSFGRVPTYRRCECRLRRAI